MEDYEEILKLLHDKFDWNLTDSLTTTGKKLVEDVLKAKEIITAEKDQALQLHKTNVSGSYNGELKKIISDEQLIYAWGNANFGDCEKRDVLRSTLLKCAGGYYTGHTAKCIVEELGLVTKKWTLTKLGQRYLYESFSHEVDV